METETGDFAVGDLVRVESGVYEGAEGAIADMPEGVSAVRIEAPDGNVYALKGTMRKVEKASPIQIPKATPKQSTKAKPKLNKR